MTIQLGSAYGEIQIGTGDAEKNVSSLTSTLRGAGQAMSLAITAPLMLVGKMALQSAGDFEQSLNIMAQVSGATAAEMAALQSQALQLGAETSFSAGEAADAMLELAKAGMDVSQISEAIGGVLDLAAAGGIDLASAATIAANAMNAFNLPASETASVANTFAAAANASTAGVGDLALGFQMAAAVFSMSGQSVNDLAASLALMSNNGIAGSDAGTSLKTMMLALMSPTDKARSAMDAMGLSVYDAQGNMRPFVEIVEQLETATEAMSDQQRDAALSTIFGGDAIRAASTLAKEGADSYTEMIDAVTKQGAAAETAAAQMAGWNGAMKYLQGSVESFLIEQMEPFLETMSGTARAVADAITAFGDLPVPMQQAALAFVAVLAAAGPVMLILSGLGAVIAFLVSPVGLVIAALALLSAAWVGNFGDIQGMTADSVAFVQGKMGLLSGIFTSFTGGEDLAQFKSEVGSVVADAQRSFGDLFSGKISLGDFAGQMGEALGRIPQAINDLFGGADLSTMIEQLQWAEFIPTFTWDGKVATFDWGEFVTTFDWTNKVATLGWGDYVLTLDWNVFVQGALDWGMYIQSLDWGAMVGMAIDWGVWITKLDWGAIGMVAISWATFIPRLAWDVLMPLSINWGAYIAKLDWAAIGLAAIDWAMWIPVLGWTSFVSAVALVAQVPKLDWGAFVGKVGSWLQWIYALDWGTFITALSWNNVTGLLTFAWDSFIAKLEWAGIVTPMEAWDTFIKEIKWTEFVEALTDWGAFVKAIDWGAFIPDFEWPTIPEFPGWSAFIGLFGINAHAAGTTFAPGGLSLVGEKGPELINLPRGSRVYNAQDTEEMLSGGGSGRSTTVNVTINGVKIDNERDMQRQAYRIGGMIAAGLAG